MGIARRSSHTKTTLVHEFFKVFMPHTSSTHLRLPKAFSRFFNGITPSKATLADHDGNSWDVGLDRMKDGLLVLKKGWEQFASDKGLEEADFLVFEYDGKSTLYVKIFSKSGIKKEPPYPGKHVPLVILDDEDSDQSCGNMQRGLKRKHSPTTLKIIEKPDSEGPSGRTRGKLKRASEANGNDYEKAPGLAKRAPLENPDFVIPFYRWRLTRMEIPRAVLRQLSTRLPSKISLRDENDKLWPVKIVTGNKWGRVFLANGWSDFRKAKDIKEGQLCDFKFVIGKQNVAQELLVRIRCAPSKCPKYSPSMAPSRNHW